MYDGAIVVSAEIEISDPTLFNETAFTAAVVKSMGIGAEVKVKVIGFKVAVTYALPASITKAQAITAIAVANNVAEKRVKVIITPGAGRRLVNAIRLSKFSAIITLADATTAKSALASASSVVRLKAAFVLVGLVAEPAVTMAPKVTAQVKATMAMPSGSGITAVQPNATQLAQIGSAIGGNVKVTAVVEETSTTTTTTTETATTLGLSKVSGSISLDVADVKAFMRNSKVSTALKDSIASFASASPNMVEVWVKAARRLHAEARRLAPVQVDYIISYPSGTDARWKASALSATAANTSAFNTLLKSNLAKLGITYKVAVVSFTATVFAPSAISTTASAIQSLPQPQISARRREDSSGETLSPLTIILLAIICLGIGFGISLACWCYIRSRAKSPEQGLNADAAVEDVEVVLEQNLVPDDHLVVDLVQPSSSVSPPLSDQVPSYKWTQVGVDALMAQPGSYDEYGRPTVGHLVEGDIVLNKEFFLERGYIEAATTLPKAVEPSEPTGLATSALNSLDSALALFAQDFGQAMPAVGLSPMDLHVDIANVEQLSPLELQRCQIWV